MLIHGINGKAGLAFDILVNIFARTNLMAVNMGKVVFESKNATTIFKFAKFA
jgi:hypothetical protein